MDQCDRRRKEGSLLSQVFALQVPGCRSRTGEVSSPTHQGSPSPLAQRSGRCPGEPQPCRSHPDPFPPSRAPGGPGGSPGLGPAAAAPPRAGAGGRCWPGPPPAPCAPRAERTRPARGEAAPVHPALSSASPPPPSSGELQRGGGALPPPLRLPEPGLRAALHPDSPGPARRPDRPGRAQGRRGAGRGGAEGEGCAQMSAGPARCCTPSSPPEGGSSRCLRQLLLFCKGCCCRWTQPSPDMELLPLPPPPPVLLE